MFVFPFSDIRELLTWSAVSPECHSAWANVDPGPVLESTSYIENTKRIKSLVSAMSCERESLGYSQNYKVYFRDRSLLSSL